MPDEQSPEIDINIAIPPEEKHDLAQQPKKRPRGNPNLQKGVAPYCVNRRSYELWLEDHIDYDTKNHASIAKITRMFLYDAPKVNGKGGKIRLAKILESLYKAATTLRSPHAVAAANALLDRGFGRTKSADEDLEAIKKGGLTVVYVDRKAVDPDIPMAQAELTEGEPEFIEGKFTDE